MTLQKKKNLMDGVVMINDCL